GRPALARPHGAGDGSHRGTGMDGEICRICEQALAGDDLPVDLRAGVSSRYAQVLLYRCEYDRAGEVSRDALAAAGSSDDPVVLVDALRARQMACCAPEGVTERVVLAGGCSKPRTP